MATWSNWAGNQKAQPTSIVHPRNVEEISATVKEALLAGVGVKPIGSAHSFTAIGVPTGVQMRMGNYNKIVELDRESGLVTVESGIPLHALNRELAANGLAMTNLGDIEVQTISGATSTGTHGTGENYGGISTQIRAMEIVLADGSITQCSPTENPELFAAARVGLGALGVVTKLTLQTVPLFALRAEEKPMHFDEVLERFDELAAAVDHFEFYWFPHTKGTLTKHNTRVSADALEPLSVLRHWLDDEFLSNKVFGAGQTLVRKMPSLIRPLNKVSSKALSARVYTDLSYKVFTSERSVRFCEMEYAIPRESVVDVLRELDAAVEASGMLISFPVEVRVAQADDIALSTASDRESAYIAVHMDYRNDHKPYFTLVESIMDKVQGRPHWGKLHYQDAESLRARYPRFDEFVTLRNKLDPTGVFTNPYLDRVLGALPA